MTTQTKRIGLYPGSFDTPTNGHINLIRRAAAMFDELRVAIANNTSKTPLLSVEERVDLLRRVTVDLDNVTIDSFEGLTVDYAREIGARVIVRGLRAVSDFEYELQMALMNQQMAPETEMIYLVPSVENTFLSSTMVREVFKLGGDISKFVPSEVEAFLKEKAKDPDFGRG